MQDGYHRCMSAATNKHFWDEKFSCKVVQHLEGLVEFALIAAIITSQSPGRTEMVVPVVMIMNYILQ